MNKLSEHHNIQHLPKLQPHLHLTERTIGRIARTRHREHHIRVYVQTLCSAEASRSTRYGTYMQELCHISADPSPFSRGRRKEWRRRHVGLHLYVIVEKQWCLTVGDSLWRSCGLGVVRGRLRDVFCVRRGAGWGFGCGWARLRCVLWPRAGACFFSFRGFRLVTSPPCGGGFFAGFASGFRWCLAVLSPWPGGCCFGRVWTRLRCVFCPGAGACFFSFRGFRLVTSPPCGGGFFAGFASGFRWCLAVLSPSPGGCCFGCGWARLRCVFCPGAGACFFSFRGFRLVTSPPCGGGFFCWVCVRI